MLRKFTAFLISLVLCWTTVACSSSQPQSQTNFNNNVQPVSTRQISNGQYPIQQATYDDTTGEYTLMLLNTPSGTSPVLRTADLQLARLTDEQIASGENPYVEIDGDQAVAYLTEDFKIEYIHSVTDTQVNPETGQQETVIVERRSSFWSPFAGALAGQALGSMLFRPQYYVPPVYQPGSVLRGYGGYGSNYSQAVNRYQNRYQTPPPAVRNRQRLRTTGRLRTPTTTTNRRTTPNSNRATGSGYGSSNLRSSGKSSPTRTKRPSSFGSGSSRRRSPSRNKSFGSRRGGRRR